MGPKAKKTPKNAFSFFLDDYVQAEREKGRTVSHRIAAEECGPLWKDMPEEEKQRYSRLAARNKSFMKNDKYTSIGISYAQLEREQKKLKEKIEQADAEIKSTISNLDFELIHTHLFYIIHCNYYCKTDEGIYVPGEIAISEFNLKDGIRRTYHTLINPGPIPLGFAYEAKQTCEEIHNLPYPPYEEGDSDYLGILHKILKFLEPGKLPDGRYPPLYCIENNIKASENILQLLSDNKSENKNYFRVFLLHKMFFWLKNKCVEFSDEEHVGFPVMSNAISEIEKDIFCYVPGISCAFHATSEEKYQNCSLSVVQRFVYVLCDHCCQYLQIPLIPGKHCRVKCDTNRNYTRAKITRPSKSSVTSFTATELNEGDLDDLSSYAESTISDWKSDVTGSFLHDELESKFHELEIHGPSSRNMSSAVSNGTVSSRKVFRLEDSEDEDNHRLLSLGRGIGGVRRKA